jgi:hypothetical protein
MIPMAGTDAAITAMGNCPSNTDNTPVLLARINPKS